MQPPPTVLLRIIAPHRAYGLYEADADAVRLIAVQHPAECGPADQGVIPGTQDVSGGEMEALLLGDVAHPPGALIEARLLALLAVASDDETVSYAVTVATTDPAFAAVSDVAAIPCTWREQLHAYFGAAAQLTWNDSRTAWECIQSARQAARRARSGTHRASSGPTWRPDQAGMAAPQNGAAAETVRHSHAEYAFYTLPLRFQKYVADYLTPLERVRFFVPRPRMTSAIERSLLRRKRLAEGILVLATEQLIFLEEVLPPDVTEMPHGYLARGTPAERIVDIMLEKHGSSFILGWATETDRGREWVRVEFPAARGDELRELRDRLTAYLLRPHDQRLRRVYAPEVAAPDLRDPAANDPRDPEPTIARLNERLQEALGQGEIALAQAFVPAWFEYGPGQAQILVITARRVLLLAERDPQVDQIYAIAEMSSLELRASILGSWFALWMPKPGGVTRIKIPFPSTGFGFQTCYRMLRQALANVPAPAKEVAACALRL